MGNPLRKPEWLKKNLLLANSAGMKKSLRLKNLHTVCESAHCPNMGECFSRGTATIMILGDTCNRTCGFCNVKRGHLLPPDEAEPENAAEMVAELALRHVVITSVTRDDLPDGGAAHFVKTLQAIRKRTPGVTVELLIPDFGGNEEALRMVCEAGPDILNHNIETVKRLYREVRPQADYLRSLRLLKSISSFGITAKSGIMVGFGESEEELAGCFEDLRQTGLDILTIGQYLPPSRNHLEVKEYFDEKWFAGMADKARSIGIKKVFAGPLVRSSYMADMVAKDSVSLGAE